MILLDKYKAIFLIFISCLLYCFGGYFLERTSFHQLVLVWSGLFFSFYFLIQNKQLTFQNLVGISLLFRLVLLFQIPNLSQDFYRFIWDGRMLLEGFNPYLYLPENFIEQGIYPIPGAVSLYEGMGQLNGSHYTNYPPLNQFCFVIAALFAGKSIFGAVIVLRVILIFADIGILYFGTQLLKTLQLPINAIFWYLLNPFIIVEMTGNLHFEPVMLFFLVWALYKLSQKKWIFAAILMACAISVKLIPLLFLPLFFQWFVVPNTQKPFNYKWFTNISGLKKLGAFYGIILATTLLFFIPFYSAKFAQNYLETVGLWFKNFEFNASFYYLFRAIGYLFRGWNEIAIIGKIMPALAVLILGTITFFRKNNSLKSLILALLFGLSFYFFTSTTMHPWYVSTLVILSVFTTYRFPVVWSFVIILSYQAYANDPWKENLWYVGLEYVCVFSFLIFELKKKNNIKLTQ